MVPNNRTCFVVAGYHEATVVGKAACTERGEVVWSLSMGRGFGLRFYLGLSLGFRFGLGLGLV